MQKQKAYLDCLPRQEAQELWITKLTEVGYFNNLPREKVAVTEALGRVTASVIFAKQSVPHYNGAAMDGIALYAPDSFGAQETAPKRLQLLQPDETFQPGGCYVVDTGDLLPTGTNAVIMIEDVHWVDDQAEVITAATPWQHVRIIGEDIVAKEVVLPEHHLIAPVDMAALLAAGIEEIEVVKRPRVAIIPTGDEIVASRQDLKPGKILDVNGPMLAAAVTQWGGDPVRREIVKDQRAAIEEAILASLKDCDMVVVNAGTSAGREDYTAPILSELGQVLVHGVAIKPGKPVILAICQDKPVIGLPGYPVSAMLTADLFVRSVVLARQKLPQPEQSQVEAFLSRQVPSTIGLEEYLRLSIGSVEGRLVAAPLGRGAGLLSSLTKAQGLLRIDPSSAGIAAGASVPVTFLRSSKPENTILAVGSHDPALELLGFYMRRFKPELSLSFANVGSLGGIMAIRNREAHLAGIHLLDEATGRYNVPYVQKYLSQRKVHLVHFAMRQQGLLVLPGNPKKIYSLEDLLRQDKLTGQKITYVNRQRGTGTRMLLDYQLKKAGIDSSQIVGYEKEVGTHMAVAASVASGTADTGLGLEAAAQALGLDFIPVTDIHQGTGEQYDLLLNFSDHDKVMELILHILKSPDFRRDVEAMGGYDLSKAGMIIEL
ncbi:molybdopterin biosynthesis protein [Heliorestis convoluta]|uniref:Molybdopterin molybdenumtransferase n=1 Tax=Heliorestis convoluta TaxID=356322 RepID=A0A5Q2MZX6_9FIRM|nr:molybdopterin biosynthesis protein [Heliorestis convoluta]QGG47013.1 molybdenum cofactor biosynthesis protein [Heliorestis convoluta]